MPRPAQDGLGWQGGLHPGPLWAREPALGAIENVCRQQLDIPSADPCTITFFASGLFNKLYRVDWTGKTLAMRVTLPVYPRHKTLGEVTTLRWVHENTKVPVPKVVAFDDSNDNEIGFEWILMDFVEGTPARKKWRKMSMEQKVVFTKHVAEIQAELSGCRQPSLTFKSIGTLHAEQSDEGNDLKQGLRSVRPGRLVAHEFFMGNHVHHDIPRGPFSSTHDWLKAQLNLVIIEQTAQLEQQNDEDDREDAEDSISSAQKLLKLLPTIFPAPGGATESQGLRHVFPFIKETAEPEPEPEPTVLHHDDLHLNNIFIDEEGAVTAVVDWECVSAVPHWVTTMMPKFLFTQSREDEPQRETYGSNESKSSGKGFHISDSLDHEGKTILFWEHKMEYEATQLRKVYKARMKELWPEWPLESSFMKNEFLRAVSLCDDVFWKKLAGRWAQRTARGEVIRCEEATPQSHPADLMD